MREAAYFLGQLLEFLQRDGGLNVETTHMIGHSLGAHLVALAAKGVSYGSSIGRITGEPREGKKYPKTVRNTKMYFFFLPALDPAAPLIENAPESERLNPRSAKFVDVIHSSAFFVGIRRPVGTVDFYPNGGYFQPGCRPHDISKLLFDFIAVLRVAFKRTLNRLSFVFSQDVTTRLASGISWTQSKEPTGSGIREGNVKLFETP